MSSQVIFPSKAPTATQALTFDFTEFLGATETISSAAVGCTTYSGTDANPDLVLYGSPLISGGIVTQAVTSGTDGVIYLLTCIADTSTTLHLVLTGLLAVVAAA